MMYQCINNHIFVIPAKLTIGSLPPQELELLKGLIETAKEEDNNSPEITQIMSLFEAMITVMGEGTFEKHVCPECRSHSFTEYTKPQEDIISVKSVDLNMVDEYLKQGYKVKEMSTTKAAIIKTQTETKQ